MRVFNADGTSVEVVRTTNGLSAGFSSIVTVNGTGTAALAANTARQLGVWVYLPTASVVGLIGNSIDTAVVPLTSGVTGVLAEKFIPGTGAIYVKTSGAGIANFAFMEY